MNALFLFFCHVKIKNFGEPIQFISTSIAKLLHVLSKNTTFFKMLIKTFRERLKNTKIPDSKQKKINQSRSR
jgi:hypothetical protein